MTLFYFYCLQASPAAGDALRQSLTAQVKQLSANYINKQQQHLATLLPQEDQSAAAATAIADSLRPYDAAGLSSFCDALSDFDEQMNQVVIDAGILKGRRSISVIMYVSGNTH